MRRANLLYTLPTVLADLHDRGLPTDVGTILSHMPLYDRPPRTWRSTVRRGLGALGVSTVEVDAALTHYRQERIIIALEALEDRGVIQQSYNLTPLQNGQRPSPVYELADLQIDHVA